MVSRSMSIATAIELLENTHQWKEKKAWANKGQIAESCTDGQSKSKRVSKNLYHRNTAHDQEFIINFSQLKIPDHFISYPPHVFLWKRKMTQKFLIVVYRRNGHSQTLILVYQTDPVIQQSSRVNHKETNFCTCSVDLRYRNNRTQMHRHYQLGC